MKISWNETTLLIIKHYGRKKLRARLEMIHRDLYGDHGKIIPPFLKK
ncbi:MAG TPA: hypothetical protein VK508_16565 [Cyclobacteriaceae bacterium]|nr:hypothetical protein [Cyclobacteriaceae bacterium]